jgi:hypothetical protein
MNDRHGETSGGKNGTSFPKRHFELDRGKRKFKRRNKGCCLQPFVALSPGTVLYHV